MRIAHCHKCGGSGISHLTLKRVGAPAIIPGAPTRGIDLFGAPFVDRDAGRLSPTESGASRLPALEPGAGVSEVAVVGWEAVEPACYLNVGNLSDTGHLTEQTPLASPTDKRKSANWLGFNPRWGRELAHLLEHAQTARA